MVYIHVPAFWGSFFSQNLVNQSGVNRDEGAQINKLGYFEQIIVKSAQFRQNWVLFYRKWYWWVGNSAKNWNRKSDFWDSAGTSTYDFGESKFPPSDHWFVQFCCLISINISIYPHIKSMAILWTGQKRCEIQMGERVKGLHNFFSNYHHAKNFHGNVSS